MRYVTFGYANRHVINGILFDKDCVALIDGEREDVFKIFGRKWCFEYEHEEFDINWLKHYPRGIVELRKN